MKKIWIAITAFFLLVFIAWFAVIRLGKAISRAPLAKEQ
jgi:hypothetical protein